MNILPDSKLVKRQTRTHTRTAGGLDMIVTIRHDDNCGNGHNSFAVTMDAYTAGKPHTDRYHQLGGCCHDEIIKYFPELEPLIKWHLTSTDGPMHYVANTTFHARDTDHHGKHKGDPTGAELVMQFGGFPITYKGEKRFIEWLEGLENYDLEIMSVPHKDKGGKGYQFSDKYTFLGYEMDTWHRCPFDSETEALEFLNALHEFPPSFDVIYTRVSEGKTPDLEAARNSAIWPTATLSELNNEALLMARLPGLMEEFKTAVESAGLEY